MKNCLVVLGMHRSGTSALTGVLERLGVDLGNALMSAAPDNPKGFFESTLVVDTNEALLEAMGSSWDSPFRLPAHWQTDTPDGELRQNAGTFLRDNIGHEHVYALKDPRMSRLLPWWQALFDEQKVSSRYVILVRNPLEIAASLAQRNGFSTRYSLLLWLHYMLDAQHYTRGFPRVFVHYDDLLDNPRDTVRRLYETCDLPVPVNVEPALAGFIEDGMRHHAIGEDEVRERCPPLVADLYSALSRIARAEEQNAADNTELDLLASQFYAGLDLYHTPELAQAVRDRRRLPENLADFLSSPPWRMYRAYQHAVFRFLPEGTPLRTFLQRAKKALPGADK